MNNWVSEISSLFEDYSVSITVKRASKRARKIINYCIYLLWIFLIRIIIFTVYGFKKSRCKSLYVYDTINKIIRSNFKYKLKKDRISIVFSS